MKTPQPQRGIFEKALGSGVWWIRFVDGEGKYRREKAGAYGLAVKLLDKRRGEAVRGEKLPELRRRTVLFGELIDLGVEYVKNNYRRPADDLARLALLRVHLSGKASTITPGQIEVALERLAREKGWKAASTRNHHHNLVSLCFRLGILHDKVDRNPARAIKRKSEISARRVRSLAIEEEKKLRAAIRSNPAWAPHEPELDLAVNTGLRRSSMYEGLTWENVDLVARTLTIPQTKNGESITLPLNDDAMRALRIFQSRGDGTGRVVRNEEGKTLAWPKDWFVAAVEKAGIKNFHWHDLRHTFATRLRETGIGLATIADLLGHRQLEMTRRYAHIGETKLHEAVSRIANSTSVAPEPVSETARAGYVN